ncbi:MAG: paraquat-inducible protein A, partial [Granulosicoccus sp.]
HYRRNLDPGQQARCDRCSDVIQTCRPYTVDRSLAVCIAALVCLAISLSTPFMSLSRAGIESNISVLDAVQALWNSQMRWLGLLTLALIAVLPLIRLMLLIWVLIRVRLNFEVRQSMRVAFRLAVQLEQWVMADIFIAGVLVSLVKTSSLARLSVGTAFWALLMLTALTLLLTQTLCKDTIWQRISAQ